MIHVLHIAAAALLLGAPKPPPKAPSTPTPAPASAEPATTDQPSPGKRKRPKAGIRTMPDVPGMVFAYVSALDFVEIVGGRLYITPGGHATITSDPDGGTYAWAHVNVPPGARLHWFECIVDVSDTPYAGDRIPTNVAATLLQARWGDHVWGQAPQRLVTVRVKAPSPSTTQEDKSFSAGARIPDADALVARDGWLHVKLFIERADGTGLLRACRVGYVPPSA